ncbi:MAG: DNA polymerase III subunit beta [Egibacteraceae bacterium]
MAKFLVDRKALVDALGAACMVIDKQSSIPALRQALLTFNGEVALTATDLETTVEIRLPRKSGKAAGAVALPACLLTGYARQSDAPDVAFEVEGVKAKLDDDMTVVGCDPKDFPATPKPDGEVYGSIDAAELAKGLRAVMFAASQEVTRYSLQGVLVDFRKDRVSIVASDGKVLAWQDAASGKTKHKGRLLILPAAVALLERLAAQAADGTVHMRAVRGDEKKGDNAAGMGTFELPSATMFSRLIQDRFPDYEAVMPVTDQSVTFDAKALRKALMQVRLATTDRTRAVKFRLDGGKCRLKAKTEDVGEAFVDVSALGKASAEFVLSPDYVLDYLKAAPSDRVKLSVKDRESGVLWEGPEGHKFVQMPLKVNL